MKKFILSFSLAVFVLGASFASNKKDVVKNKVNVQKTVKHAKGKNSKTLSIDPAACYDELSNNFSQIDAIADAYGLPASWKVAQYQVAFDIFHDCAYGIPA